MITINSDGTVTGGTGGHGLRSPGSVVQTLSTTKTDAFSTSSTSFVDITGLSVNITPTSSSSKVLVQFIIACGNDAATQNRFELVRQVGGSDTSINPNEMDSSTAMFYVDADGSNETYTRAQVAYNFLDSPSTTGQVNYRLRTKIYSSSVTQYVNRAAYSSNTIGSSTITVMEIAA